jgi:hypothetical protein
LMEIKVRIRKIATLLPLGASIQAMGLRTEHHLAKKTQTQIPH